MNYTFDLRFNFYWRPSMTKTIVVHCHRWPWPWPWPWLWVWARWHQVNGHRDKELAEEPEPEVFAEPLIEVLVIMIHLYWRGCQDPYSTIATLTSARLTTNYHGLLDSFLLQVTSRRDSGGEALVATNVNIFSHYFFILAPYCLISCKHVIFIIYVILCKVHNLESECALFHL